MTPRGSENHRRVVPMPRQQPFLLRCVAPSDNMPMATIYIPPSLQTLTDGLEKVELEALRVSDAVQVLEQRFPGIESRLCEGDQLSPGLQVSVDGSLRGLGLLCRLNQDSEVHFLPALGGG